MYLSLRLPFQNPILRKSLRASIFPTLTLFALWQGKDSHSLLKTSRYGKHEFYIL